MKENMMQKMHHNTELNFNKFEVWEKLIKYINKCERYKMKYYNFLTIFLMVIFIVSIGYSHGDGDEHKKKQKVTSQTMNSESANTMMEDHDGESEEHMETQMKTQMGTDFNTIRKDVEDSATFVILKAGSLAVAIFGLAIVYLPRRKKEEHNA